MKTIAERFYVITGGPGVGKTTLLNELNKSGFRIVPEEARRIIKEQVENEGNGLPWKDKELYATLMLNASVKTYQEIRVSKPAGIVFFDRGILDTFCYMEMEKMSIPAEIDKIARENNYNKKVFILPPWIDIYENDTERKQSWEEALFTFDKMKETYLKYGYDVIEVPRDTVSNRREFILKEIETK